MSTLGFKGGFAAFMDGFTKAQDKEYQRDRQKKEDDWVENQHKRTLDEQTRQDQLRQDLMDAGKDTIDESATTDPAKPVMRKRTQDELMFASADAYRKAGDIAKYHELATAGNKIAMERAANNFNRLYYNADGLAPEQLVNQAIGIFNQDPTVGHIENPQYREDGSVTFDTVNKRTGERISHTARDSKSLLEDMHAYYNPQGYAAKQARIAEQAAKVEKLGAGDQLVQNGRVIATNANEPAAVQAARIRASGRDSGGAGGRAEKPVNPKIVKSTDGDGNIVFHDENSGAVGTLVTGTPGKNAVTHWFGPDDPAVPETPTHIVWTTADGQPLPKGPQSLYQQLPVNKQTNPAQPGAKPAQQFIKGKVYKDANGNRAMFDGEKFVQVR